ncbi:nucleotide-binding protein [Burkholderia sp. FERM BP-3421]|uniref:TIR domain-containing protein n=1 Tax=Burkholderia sp. FERM BP-3421 TaxID=1494466 RepID=UPI00235F5292|nr:TIR domain-containing protein [Burkholderia sp. FERM BP-3421]WDD93506.1 nucleotide-binding protein [Burkholderia sp. FERM BP-3421]
MGGAALSECWAATTHEQQQPCRPVQHAPDDKSRATVASADEPEPRARQNVILELRHFAAKPGGGHVCALRRGNVEIPSDFTEAALRNYSGPKK